MIFRFVVKHLRWLTTVPGLPHVFDAMLLIATTLFNRERLEAMQMLEHAALEQSEIKLRPHRFGGVGFFLDSHELCHLHGNGLFDALVGRTKREELIKTRKALEHHVFPASGWISFWINNREDALCALEFITVASNSRCGQRLTA